MTTLSAPRLHVWFRIDALVFGAQDPPAKILQDIAENFQKSATKIGANTPHTHVGTIRRLQEPFPVEFTRVSFSCNMNTLWPGDEDRADGLVQHEQALFVNNVLGMLEKKYPAAHVAAMARNDNEAGISNACVLTLSLYEDQCVTFRQVELQDYDDRARFWHRFWDDDECEPPMWTAFQECRPQQFEDFLVKLKHSQLESVLAAKKPSSPSPRF